MTELNEKREPQKLTLSMVKSDIAYLLSSIKKDIMFILFAALLIILPAYVSSNIFPLVKDANFKKDISDRCTSTTAAHITCIHEYKNYYEYTFSVGKDSFDGICSMSSEESETLTDGKTIEVVYNSDAPYENLTVSQKNDLNSIVGMIFYDSFFSLIFAFMSLISLIILIICAITTYTDRRGCTCSAKAEIVKITPLYGAIKNCKTWQLFHDINTAKARKYSIEYKYKINMDIVKNPRYSEFGDPNGPNFLHGEYTCYEAPALNDTIDILYEYLLPKSSCLSEDIAIPVKIKVFKLIRVIAELAIAFGIAWPLCKYIGKIF